MTDYSGPIVFGSGGSDSLASGLGPSTAVNDTTEGTTASWSTTTITFSGATDLSGVSAGDVLYLFTSTGQKFFTIATVNDGADSLTVDTAPTGTTSGLAWAIGGKRLTWDDTNSRQLFLDLAAGGIVHTEISQTLTSAFPIDLTGTEAAHVVIGGDDDDNPATITMAANAGITVTGAYVTMKNLDLEKTVSTGSGSAVAITGSIEHFTFIRVHVRHATNTWSWGFSRSSNPQVSFYGCELAHLTHGTILWDGYSLFSGCYIHDCSSHGITNVSSSDLIVLHNCIFADNGGYGAHGVYAISVTNCLFVNNTSSGLYVLGTGRFAGVRCVINNIFAMNGGYGFESQDSPARALNDHNAYYSNTSGQRRYVEAGIGDITLTADPFTDEANQDYTLNDTAGGGAALKGLGFDAGALPSATNMTPGPYQVAGGGGGGGGTTVAQGLQAIETGITA